VIVRQSLTARPAHMHTIGYAAGAPRVRRALREAPVTVIAACRESEDSLLIAADSGETEAKSGRRLTTNRKLHRHRNEPLAWAISGNPTIGDQGLNQWLAGQVWPPASWHDFLGEIADRVAFFNGRQRDRARLAGVTDIDQHTTQLVVVAWAGEPHIYEFDDTGRDTPYVEAPLLAVGTGNDYFFAAYMALDQFAPLLPILDRFAASMQVAATHAPACGEPCYVWRVRADGISEVDVGAVLTALRQRVRG
jgi:hypothetical protein